MSKELLRAKTIYFRDETSPIVKEYMSAHGLSNYSEAVNHIFQKKGKLSRAEIIQLNARNLQAGTKRDK